jgi:hypothetical protein
LASVVNSHYDGRRVRRDKEREDLWCRRVMERQGLVEEQEWIKERDKEERVLLLLNMRSESTLKYFYPRGGFV